MKKLFMCLTVIVFFIGINKVSADTVELPYSDTLKYNCNFYVTDYDYLVELDYSDELQEVYNLLIEEYNTKYSSVYPYYYLDVVVLDSQNCNLISNFNSVGRINVFLNLYEEIPSLTTWLFPDSDLILFSSYTVSSDTYELPVVSSGYAFPPLIYDSSSERYYNQLGYFVSNFDLIYNGTDTYQVTGNDTFEISPGTILQPVFSVEDAFQEGYEEINLNDYAYVALSLKNYNQEAFNTTMYFKGQICLTPVYDYGMNERKNILSGTKVKRCNPYYNDFTPVNISVTSSDLKYYSIYYLKPYDLSKENYIKIDTTIFDVTLITEENKDNPYVYILDRYYPTIPFDSLTDTANISEDEDYIDGAVEEFDPIGTATDTWSEIIENPIKALKEVWSSIVTIFDLIFDFYGLLPADMRTFLMSAFMIAVIIGLIKIVL